MLLGDQFEAYHNSTTYYAFQRRGTLADIVKTSDQKLKDLQQSVANEAASFAKAQAQKAADFQQSQQDQAAAHQDTISGIQKDLDTETAKGRFADQSRLSDLRDRTG